MPLSQCKMASSSLQLKTLDRFLVKTHKDPIDIPYKNYLRKYRT